MTKDELNREALGRARRCSSLANCLAVVSEFKNRGIPESEIDPGQNVLTYRAWLGAGRQVRRGEKGVQVATRIPCTKTDEKTGKEESYTRPWMATVFHVTQTDLIGGAA